MDLIAELNNAITTKSKTNNSQEFENVAVEFLSEVDFTDPEIRKQAVDYIRFLLKDYVEQNREISSVDAKNMHCMITKMSLDMLGLKGIKINYRDRTDKDDPGTGAYYFDKDKSLNFFNQSVCNETYLLLPYGDAKDKKGGESRLSYFDHQVETLEHEIQHAVQYKEMEKVRNGKEDFTVETFVMTRQDCARIIAQNEQNTKGYKHGKEAVKLYGDYWKDFYYELDAEKHGIERMFDWMKKLSPKAYEIAMNESRNIYVAKLKEKNEKLKDYFVETWRHNSNPERPEMVVNHKASMVFDNILPKLSGKDRKMYFDYCQALSITNKPDGTLKTLDEIKKEKQSKIRELLINGSDEEIRKKVTNISKVYDAAIESDPILCFEKCLQHISELSWDSDRYFVDHGDVVKYDPNYVRKELSFTEKKAKAISSYMEDIGASRLEQSIKKYEKSLERNLKKDKANFRFYDDKKRALEEIKNEINLNIEVNEELEKNAKEALKIKAEKTKVEEILARVFPDFKPHSQIGTIKDGSVIFSNNVNEKLMLNEAYKNYVRTILNDENIDKSDKNFVRASELLSAIKCFYDFQPTIEEINKFNQMLKNGKIKVPRNLYEKADTKDNEVNSTKKVTPNADEKTLPNKETTAVVKEGSPKTAGGVEKKITL